MFHREHLTTSRILAWDDGVFLTYYEFNVNRQILLWLNHEGTILQEDSLVMPPIQFAYIDANQAVLVSEDYNNWLMTRTFAAHSFNADGSPESTDTIFVQQFVSDQYGLASAYHYDSSELTIFTGTVISGSSPDRYELRIVRYDGGDAQILPTWNPGPIASEINLYPFSVHSGPFGASVIGYAEQSENDNRLSYNAVSPEGAPGLTQATVSISAQADLNGLATLIKNGGVYAAYTLNDPSEMEVIGAYVTAFPLEDILAAAQAPRSVPAELSLTAYPNPFNSSVRIDYRIPVAGEITLTIYDLAGRETARFHRARDTFGTGSWQWTPKGVASGFYVAALKAGDLKQSTRLLYLK